MSSEAWYPKSLQNKSDSTYKYVLPIATPDSIKAHYLAPSVFSSPEKEEWNTSCLIKRITE